MTDDRKRKPEPPARPKATFGGETVEPRILMSVTWLAPGTAGNDTINGTAGDDGLQGLGGNDTLMGNGGDDVLRGGLGNDSLQGGSGTDIADYSTASGSVTVSLQTNTASDAGGDDTLSSIEGVIGSAFDDVITGSIGNNTLSGGGGNDTIISSSGNDTVDGGSGVDTIDYRNAFFGVTVDLTKAGPQNTGFGGGIDTLSNLEGVSGSIHADTFAFADPVDGALYTVDGGIGSDKIDLSGFASSAVSFSDGHLTIDLGGGQSFGIDYSNVETIEFADVDAVVVTSDLNVDSFVGSRIVVDGDEAFRMDVAGSGSLDGSYSTTTDTLTITDTNGTDSGTNVTITDLTGTDLVIGTIAIDNDLGTLTSNVDIGAIEITGNFNTITTVTIAGGNGTLGSFHATGKINSATTLDATVGTIDLDDSLQGELVVNGDLGSMTAGQIDVNGGLTLRGDAGSLSTGDVLGEVRVDGNVGSLSTAYVGDDITILGDLGSASIASVGSGATITVQSVVGTLDFQVGGVQHGGTFASVIKFVFDGATQTATTTGTNVAPIANAGPDQIVNEGDTVTLTGLGSSDADGDSLSYTWVQTAGPTVTLVGRNDAQPTFTAPEGLVNSTVTFGLIVGDGITSSVSDSITITINADNDAPAANAGVDQTVGEGDLVTLTGLASTDPEAQGLSYTWVQTAGPTVTLSDANAARPTFTAPEGLTNTAVQFSLTVSDGTNTSVDTVAVTIIADNDAPTANAGADQTAGGGAVVTLDASASNDPEAQGLTYTWTQVSGPTVALSDPNAAQPTFTPQNPVDPQVLRFQVAVSDGTSVAIDTVDVTVTPRGLIGHWTFEETGQIVNDVSGNGNDGQLGSSAGNSAGDPTRVVDPQRGNVLSFDGNDYVTGVGMGPSGDFSIAAWVQHDLSGSGWQTIYSSGNDETWFGIDAGSGKVGLNVGGSSDWFETAAGAISTTGWHHVVGTWDGTAGHIFVDGVELPVTVIGNPTNPVSTPAAIGAYASDLNTYRYEGKLDDIRVYDVALPTADAEAIFGNLAPTAGAGADQTVNEGDLVTLTGLASSDPEAQALTYTWVQTSGPTVTLSNANAAQPTFTAPEGLTNTAVQFSLTVSDGTNTSSVDTVTVTVNADNDAPAANAGAGQTVNEGDVVTLTGLGSSDPEAQGLTYSWMQTSGPAVTLSNANAAQPTFTAPEGLTNTAVQFSLTVSDGTNTSSVDTVTVTINADNDAPTANAGADQTVAEGDVVTLSGLGSTDPEGQTLTYTWVQTSGPAVTLSNANAAQPTFSTPEGLTNSTVQFTLTVSDGTSTSVDTVAVTINADNDAPTAGAGADQTVNPSDTVQLRATGDDPESSPLSYAWRQVSGSPVTLSDPATAAPTFVAPGPTASETLIFAVDVSDGVTTTTDTVAIAIAGVSAAPNAAPEVRVEATPTANAGDSIVLSAIATDADGDGLRYAWTQLSGPPAALMASDQPRATFVAPVVSHSTALVFQVEVTDGTSTTAQIVAVAVEPIVADKAPATAPDQDSTPTQPTATTPPPVDQGTSQPTSLPWPGNAPAPSGGSPAPVGSPDTIDDQSSTSGAAEEEPRGSNSPAQSAITASDDASAHDATLDRSTDTEDAEAQLLASDPPHGQPDLVVAAAGHDVELAPTLPIPADGDVNYVWKQTAGTAVVFDETAAGKLRVRLPEVFSEEELVFEVEMLSGTERVVQEITVQVQPVSMTSRQLGIDDVGRVEVEADAARVSEAAGHGVGRIWATLVSFFATRPGRSER